jgi:methionyl-tRNA formyltransferase
MKLIFAGTPEFAVRVLAALVASEHPVTLVLTQADRPAGRGMKTRASPVKQFALSRGIALRQPANLKDSGEREALSAARADVLVVAAYGLILPQAVLDIPRLGAINVHTSLLPRWRGAAPIQRALLAGDSETGVSIMQMEAGLDTGPVLMAGSTPILDTDTAQSLHDRLADMGAQLLVEALARIEAGSLTAKPQSQEGATYASKIDKSETRIDWNKDATEIHRQVRAFYPAPGAVTRIRGAEVKVLRAELFTGPTGGRAGGILSTSGPGIAVACGRGVLVLTELQRAGGKRLAWTEFLRGCPLAVGESFE